MPKIGDFLKGLSDKFLKKRQKPSESETQEDVNQTKEEKFNLGKLFLSIARLPKFLWARKILLIIVLSSIILLSIGISIGKKAARKETTISEGTQTVENLLISIPFGAFPYEKSFKVWIPPQGNLRAILNTGNFVSPIFELVPSDGRYDMAMLPIIVRYYLPSSLLGSNDSNSLSFAAISSDGKAYNIIPGSFIGKDSRGYYVEADFFVVPRWIGVVSIPGRKLDTGIMELYKTISAKPTLLIVPGSDPGFSGYYQSTKVSNVSLWQSVFSDRSIMIYKYPVNETRSYNYTALLEVFKNSNPIPSSIVFEAERLADQLKKYQDLQFDILAHEIGGLVVYYCLAKHPEIKNVRKVAYVSTPFYGSNVLDPRLASSIYLSKPSAAGILYNLPESVVSTLQGYLKSYIEAVNVYYSDIIPNSEFLKLLRYLPYRTDVQAIAYMGNTPPMSIDVTSSLLERLFPELVINLGDGVVSKNSARLPYMTLKIFNGSWNNFYMSDEFTQEIKNYFDYQLPQIPSYKDDTFSERVTSEKEKFFERFLSSETAQQFQVDEWKIGDNPYIKFIQTLPFQGNQIAIYGGVIYTADEKGLYVSGTRVWEENIMNLKETIDGISYETQDKVYYRKLADVVSYNSSSADDSLATRSFAIFAKPRPNEKVDFVDETGNVIVTLRGIYGKVIYDGDEIILMTNREIYRYYYGIKYTAPLGLYKSYDMTYAIVVDDYVIATTRAYGLLVFNRAGNYAYTGEGWVGNLGLYKSGNYIVAIGDSFITLIDFENKKLERIVENIPGIVYDATIWENKLYVMTSDGVLIYQIQKR
ncbi:MAG: hypothetical protein ACP5JS_01625 [Fervidobacterium sp.]